MADSIRVLIVCEGQTEASFVKTCLAPLLALHGVQVSPSLLKARPGKQGGGNVTLSRLGRHLANEYPNFDYLTTLVDLYGFGDRRVRWTPIQTDQETIKRIFIDIFVFQ